MLGVDFRHIFGLEKFVFYTIEFVKLHGLDEYFVYYHSIQKINFLSDIQPAYLLFIKPEFLCHTCITVQVFIYMKRLAMYQNLASEQNPARPA